MIDLPLQQEFVPGDLVVILLLIILEGVLSIDNALVLGLLARRLPKALQGRALTYGLVGAFVFRFVAIFTASFLLRWRIVKLLGGLYLIYVSAKYFIFEAREKKDEHLSMDADGSPTLIDESTGNPVDADRQDQVVQARTPGPMPSLEDEASDPSRPLPATSSPSIRVRTAKFWSTVFVIEMTDIAFAIDSILAAIALVGSPPPGHVGPHPKLWVVVTGGFLGVILMRFAARLFIRLLDRFPRFEISAYLLVLVIGGKLSADWGFNTADHPHRLDFHDYTSIAFWVFWVLMLVCLGVGFIPKREKT